jgi:hypothetical protein
MQLADRVRQGDRDGRGNLSLAALVTFTKWFLAVCEDQVTFMAGMFDFDRIGERLTRYAARSGFGERAGEHTRQLIPPPLPALQPVDRAARPPRAAS